MLNSNSYSSHNNNSFSFSEIGEDEIFLAILAIKNNSIGSDMLPLKFLKLCLPALIPVLCHLFNYILSSNTYPKSWKVSRVCCIPKIKDPILTEDFRPISLVPSISKAFEYIIDMQIKDHLNTNNLRDAFQSGFRSNHSTTTVLTHITDFIRTATDRGNYVILILLDFSKAFNSISFEKMYHILLSNYKFSSNAAKLILSYLCNRSQYVELDGLKSRLLELNSGIPQGLFWAHLYFQCI